MARINLLRGFHRLLLVMWVTWGLTVIGYVTWDWWTNDLHNFCGVENYLAGIEYCPWLFILHDSKTLAFYRAAQYLVIGPGMAYATLMSMALALRWVWRGLVAGERKDTV
jgi:hypothetical protein